MYIFRTFPRLNKYDDNYYDTDTKHEILLESSSLKLSNLDESFNTNLEPTKNKVS